MSDVFPIPTLSDTRQQNYNYIGSHIGVPLLGNDTTSVLSDVQAVVAHYSYQYIEWLSGQLLPDTAGSIFLDKWASIFLVNSDGTFGRKSATYATGSATITAQVPNTILPAGTTFLAQNGSASITLASTQDVTVGTSATAFNVRSLSVGSAANLPKGTGLRFTTGIPGLNVTGVLIVAMGGGTDQETDDELRARILSRIRQPPMSGDASDYEQWALSVPGITRAWCSANEMGPGSVVIRVMADDLRASNRGIPTAADLAAVAAYIDTVRPVCVRDFYVVAPTLVPVSFTITGLNRNTVATQNAISAAVSAMIFANARPAQTINGTTQPAQTIFASSVSSAISRANGVKSFDLQMTDYVPANNGCLATLGSIKYD